MAKNKLEIPSRDEINNEDKWDLSKLYESPEAWEEGLKEYEAKYPKIADFKGTLGNSAAALRDCLVFMNDLEQLDERIGYYAHLRTNEDEGNSSHKERFARYMSAAAQAGALGSYQTPEIQAIPDETMKSFLESDELAEFRIILEKMLRFKPHILSEKEERLLALQAESSQAVSQGFSALTNVDMNFGTIKMEQGEVPLTQSTFSVFLINSDREIRKKAYHQFYDNFEGHKNTLAALYNGSVQQDIYRSRIRGYSSARAKALFPDKVSEEVYDNLVSTIGKNLPKLHKYYEVRRKVLGIDKLSHYDVYVPMIKDIQVKHTYDEAVDVIVRATAPLGEEYTRKLKEGLIGTWVDKYENKGKRSGAFSAGSFVGEPYILMNFKEDVLRDVFTLAHEGGHSMHSWYSASSNPFQHYNYTIFEAEVASTFNEQLLAKYLLERAETKEMKAYLIGKQVDDIIATIFRQTMFAEFEHISHKMVEEGQPLTVDSLRKTYRELLEKYFGPEVDLPEQADLEGLRIPHFYRAFYVYKYATGLSAAVTLAERVLNGGDTEREEYLSFLKSGGSRYPLESLKLAGVDMGSPEPVQKALDKFEKLTKELAGLL
ncbi:MAG: oligoendopeptidase F [Spirochaetales bacterium]|nr:oligoendopeptidase F [Spirochaetales bacterium]